MKRKEFIKKLGMGSMIIPIFASCSKEEDPTPSNEGNGNPGENVANCTNTATETAGPFPTKDPSSLLISDIRADRTGVLLNVTLTIYDQSKDCVPLEGALVDIWHCDKDGYYSEYGGSGMQNVNYNSVHFLRGRQITDENGVVEFITIFPGWYQGRSTHIHVHIYDESGQSLLVTQIAFPEGNNSAVYTVNAASEYGYTKGMSGYTYNENDNVFSDGVNTELAEISGSLEEGYSLNHGIVV